MFLLDTNTASHVIRDDQPRVRERLLQVPLHELTVSVITQAELLYGVAKRGRPAGLTSRVQEFLLRVQVLPWTAEVAEIYSERRSAWEARGISLAPMDMLIAAHAAAVGAWRQLKERPIVIAGEAGLEPGEQIRLPGI